MYIYIAFLYMSSFPRTEIEKYDNLKKRLLDAKSNKMKLQNLLKKDESEQAILMKDIIDYEKKNLTIEKNENIIKYFILKNNKETKCKRLHQRIDKIKKSISEMNENIVNLEFEIDDYLRMINVRLNKWKAENL